MTKNVKYVRKVSIRIKEMELSEPTDTDTALHLLEQDDIEEYTEDSMIIFETADKKKEEWNEQAIMESSLNKAINEW